MVAKRGAVLLLSSSMLFALDAQNLLAQFLPDPAGEAQSEITPAKAPARPLSPAETQPSMPKVSCAGSTLSVQADNSTMGSVLAAVRSCIGITLEIPEESSAIRMYTNLGPGPVNEVLQSLLSSTDLDYVIQSSSTNPQKIQAVLLMPRLKDTKDVQVPTDRVLTTARRAWLETRRNGRPSAGDKSEDSPGSEQESVVSSDVQPPAKTIPDTAGYVASETAAPTNPQEKPSVSVSAAADAAQTLSTAPVVASTEASAAATSDLPAPPAPDAAATSQAANETQQKITSMELMFEQRKQMLENQGATPKQP